MATLYFKVSSDWEQVVKLRQECEKLETQLKKMDSRSAPAATKTLETQLASTKQQMMGIVTEAAKAGAEIENGFKKKIYDASQTVNGLSEKIIAQRAVIKDIEFDVKRLGDAYRTALKNNPIGASGKLAEYNAARKALDEEKAALFGLTQQQAEARLSVKKLRDEYSLYKKEAGDTVEINNGLSLSWGKMLGIIGGATALKSLASQIVRVRGEFQSMQTAIETMVGKDVASGLMTQLKEMAKISPLTLTDMVNAEKMMLGFNIQAEDTVRYLQALSDISMGDSVKFKSLTLAFSQMSAAGKLMGQDLNQMINAGFNPLQIIAEKTGKSIATLKDEMSKGAVSAEMVQQAFIDATSAGGKFYQMSENASKTINGQLSMMQDALDNAFNEMGQASEGVIMEGIQLTTTLIQNYETVGKVLVGLIATYGAYRTAVMLATIATSKHTIAEVALTNARVIARKAQLLLNAAMLTNPYVAVATVVAALVATMWTLSDSTSAASKATRGYNQAKEEAAKKDEEHKRKIEELLTVARDESLATLTRQKSLETLREEYPKIFEQYDIEKLKLEDILDIKRRINEEDSKRSSQSTRDIYYSLRESVSNRSRYLQLFDNPELRKNMSDKDMSIWRMYAGNQSYVEVREEMEKEAELIKKYQKDVFSDNANSFLGNIKNMTDKDISSALDEITISMKALGDAGKDAMAIVTSVGGGEVSLGQLKTIQSALETEQKSRAERTTYAEDYEQARKNWEEAKKELQKIEADKNKFTSKQYENAKKRVEATEKAYKELGGDTKNKGVKSENSILTLQSRIDELEQRQAQDRIRQQVDLENQVAQARIDAMADGAEKASAQRELDNKKELEAIERQKEEYKQKVIQSQKEIFDAQEELKTKQNPNYKKRSFDSSSVSVDTSMFDIIYDFTQKKQVNDRIREQEQAMNRYLQEYGTFQQKRLAITEEYQQKISKAETEGEKLLLQKQMEEALSGIDMDELKESINWELVFSDLGNVSKKSLQQIKKQLGDFKESAEYKDMGMEQKKVVDEALNNIQSAIIDKGGLLGDLPTQLEELRKAQEDLTQAQEEYNKALAEGTDEQKEAAQKKLNKSQQGVQKAQLNVERSTKTATDNLLTLADAITQLGGNSEMTLSEIGRLAGGIADTFAEAGSKIGGIIGAIFTLLDQIGKQGLDGFLENVFSSVGSALYGVFDTLLGWGGFDFGGESDPTLERDIERLTTANQELEKAINNLSDKMDESSLAEALDIYEVQKENIQKMMANTRDMMYRSVTASSDGFLGIGGHHSSGYKIDNGMSAQDWEAISKVIGRQINGAGEFFMLSSEEMWKVANEATTEYAKLKELADDGYKDAAQFMDEYIGYWQELENLENEYSEKLTSVSFDTIRNDFRNALLGMEDDAEAFSENFEKMMKDAVLESMMTEKYDKRLKDWYKLFSGYMEGGYLGEGEQDDLRKEWQGIVNDALEEWKHWQKIMGWDTESSANQQQSASSRGFGTEMTHEDAGELSGRFTALNESSLRQESIQQGISDIADDMRNIIAQSYIELQQISENTGDSAKYLKDIKADISIVKQNTSRI